MKASDVLLGAWDAFDERPVNDLYDARMFVWGLLAGCSSALGYYDFAASLTPWGDSSYEVPARLRLALSMALSDEAGQ